MPYGRWSIQASESYLNPKLWAVSAPLSLAITFLAIVATLADATSGLEVAPLKRKRITIIIQDRPHLAEFSRPLDCGRLR